MFKFIKRYFAAIVARRRPATEAPPQTNVVVITLNRLTQAQYAALEKQVHAVTVVNQTTTELQAGYQLGMQHALKALREGWVVE